MTSKHKKIEPGCNTMAKVAAAYEVAARGAQVESQSNNPYVSGLAVRISDRIRALATPDQSSALAAVIADAKAEALSGPWEDKPDALTDAVYAAHPVFTKDYRTYTDALELVSNRHGKGALVGLVNYLMAQNKAAEARGMRRAAEIATNMGRRRFTKDMRELCSVIARRILAAIDVQPDPRDEVIARLVEALRWQADQPEAHPFMVLQARTVLAEIEKGGV